MLGEINYFESSKRVQQVTPGSVHKRWSSSVGPWRRRVKEMNNRMLDRKSMEMMKCPDLQWDLEWRKGVGSSAKVYR